MIAAMIVLGAAVPALAHLSAGFPCTEAYKREIADLREKLVGAEQTRVRAEVRLHLVVGLHLDFDPVIHRLLGQVSRLEIGARVR